METRYNGDGTVTVTRTVYAVAWETEEGEIFECIWTCKPSGVPGTHCLGEIEITYRRPANLYFVRADKSERIAMLKAELAKLGAAA